MKKTGRNTSQNFLKQFFAFGLVFFVLISTCSIQRGIKTVFGIPLEIAQTAKGAKIASASFGTANCTKCADIQVLTVEQAPTQASAILLTAIFTFLFSSLLFPRETKIILKTPNLNGEIPKYLLFSRLLFYDLR